MSNIVVVVQARMGSSRLPGKVLKPLHGEPLIVRQLQRMALAKTPFQLVVAATTDAADDRLVQTVRESGFTCFRGHPDDLLDRHLRAAEDASADVVVKIPSDCPLIDPTVIDRVLTFYLEHAADFDFVSNLHPATYPDGNDVEIMTIEALRRAWTEATEAHEREHTTPYLWDHQGRFRVGNVTWASGLDYSMTHRFTIDYPEDYAFISAVYDALLPRFGIGFGLGQILKLLEDRPDIMALNQKFAGVNWYRNHLDDLKTVHAKQTRMVEGTP